MRLTLSEFDQAVFDELRVNKWLRPVDLLRGDARMFDFFSYFGDLFLPRRLRDWARHAPRQPAVLMREEANAVNEYTAYSFRLTAFGMRLRERGLESPDQAPSMFIGGCRVYGTKPTWIRRNRGKHWRIEKLEA